MSEIGGSVAVTFEIKDNGVGIPKEKQHALFVPFCQPADHKTAKTKGTGLGLVITKAIVECMGGEIDFESVEGKMTRFFFTVEFTRARESVDIHRNDDSEAAEGDFVEDDRAGSDLDRLPLRRARCSTRALARTPEGTSPQSSSVSAGDRG